MHRAPGTVPLPLKFASSAAVTAALSHFISEIYIISLHLLLLRAILLLLLASAATTSVSESVFWSIRRFLLLVLLPLYYTKLLLWPRPTNQHRKKNKIIMNTFWKCAVCVHGTKEEKKTRSRCCLLSKSGHQHTRTHNPELVDFPSRHFSSNPPPLTASGRGNSARNRLFFLHTPHAPYFSSFIFGAFFSTRSRPWNTNSL